MDLTNCPLSSFAVCADPNAGAREQARIEKQKKPSYDLFICDKTKRIEEI